MNYIRPRIHRIRIIINAWAKCHCPDIRYVRQKMVEKDGGGIKYKKGDLCLLSLGFKLQFKYKGLYVE